MASEAGDGAVKAAVSDVLWLSLWEEKERRRQAAGGKEGLGTYWDRQRGREGRKGVAGPCSAGPPFRLAFAGATEGVGNEGRKGWRGQGQTRRGWLVHGDLTDLRPTGLQVHHQSDGRGQGQKQKSGRRGGPCWRMICFLAYCRAVPIV